MTLKPVIRTIVPAAILLLLSTLAVAQTLPPYQNAIFSLAPGCSVTQAMNLETTEVSFLNCGGTATETVTAFYKERLASQGFTITVENKYAGGNMLVAQKDELAAAVDVATQDGSTMVSLTLDGMNTQGTPPAAAAPAPTESPAEEQAMAEPDDQGTTKEVVDGQGLAAPIWEIVTPPDGDVVTNEFTVNENVGADMSTTRNVKEIMDYYQAQLTGKGWQAMTSFLEADGGLLQMFKGSQNFQVYVEAPDPGQDTEYMLMLSKSE